MSQDDLRQDDRPPAKPAASTTKPAPRGRGGTLALAILLALAAIGGTGYVGWQQWRRQGDSAMLVTLQQQVASLQGTVSSLGAERDALRQQLGDASQTSKSLRDEVQGLAERTRSVEDVAAKLSERSLSSHDSALLDETEALLRMAQQRYELFHDAAGAATAYALAEQSLAAVDDAGYASLRQTLSGEREALAKSQPAGQAEALASLGQLRDIVATLPLRPLDESAASGTPGVWARIRSALASVISVHRDNGAPLAVADARFARELAALDLAQAQAALLAYDNASFAAALQRVELSLDTQFDNAAPAVQEARNQLAQLKTQFKPAAPVQLGASLEALRNLRTVRAAKPVLDAAPAAAPASAGSAPEARP